MALHLNYKREDDKLTKKLFVLGRTLHLDKDDNVVEETDPASVKVLGGKGLAIDPADVRKYKLDDSHREPEPEEEAAAEAEAEEDAASLRGKLADDFPGKEALEAADLGTYAKVRNAINKDPEGWYADVKGVGEKLSVKIAEAVGAETESE